MVSHGYRLGLVSAERYEDVEARRRRGEEEVRRLGSVRAAPTAEVNRVLRERGASPIETPTPLLQLLRRPELSYDDIARLVPEAPPPDPIVARQVEVAVKYEGYVARMIEDVRRFKAAEECSSRRIRLPGVPGLPQVKERLTGYGTRSLGQGRAGGPA